MPRDRFAFRAPDTELTGFAPAGLSRLLGAVGDISLVVSPDGIIRDVAFAAGDPTGVGPDGWIGRVWQDLVSIESKPKIAEMLSAATEPPRWRQINHQAADDTSIPIRYLAVADAPGSNLIVIGHDQRREAKLQQRLIQTQQSLERDYLKLRQAEARYRLLFDLDAEAVLIVDADSRRIREANPAAHALVKARPGALINRALNALFNTDDHDAVLTHLGAASISDDAAPVTVRLTGGKQTAILSARAFRQERSTYLLVRLLGAVVGRDELQPMRDLIDRLPDALVVTDAALAIVSANAAFIDLAQEVSLARVRGVALGDYLGRAGIDVDLMIDQLRQHGIVRNLTTIMRGRTGSVEEVEVSAVPAPMPTGDGYGFSIRSVGRRARDLPAVDRDLPRSVEQLTELVGRMSLKDIVRESTDLIERLCIEAALQYTSDNRASAAEILGVSRQSLYSKLHRHGLGNLVSEEDV